VWYARWEWGMGMRMEGETERCNNMVCRTCISVGPQQQSVDLQRKKGTGRTDKVRGEGMWWVLA
jgi:hypothetical protein